MSNGEAKATWMTFERVVTIGSILISVGSILTTLNTLNQRVTSLELKTVKTDDAISEMRGDVKVLLERTDPRHEPRTP